MEGSKSQEMTRGGYMFVFEARTGKLSLDNVKKTVGKVSSLYFDLILMI
jgi:hypothetical protein